jgi:2-keto-4-pentenoate hydratase/2-oxohepta-3-ene-1,7-dioic acid hydratase in catechol pathway
MSDDKVELVNLNGRATLIVDGKFLDVENRSNRAFSSDHNALFARWPDFFRWARSEVAEPSDPVADPSALGPCVPSPGQIFAIGLNYRAHARESDREIPKQPMVFTKFPSCVSGPRSDIRLTSDTVDWEAELVVVIGAGGRDIPERNALAQVAGYCVGQDISDRRLQFSDSPPQFSLAKSAPGFGPIGPAVVPLQSLSSPLDLALRCDINGERMQDARTSDMIFSVPVLVSYLSSKCILRPGDLIFTGTPSGVGSVRDPRRYLKAGDFIESEIEGVGVLGNRCL